MFKTLKFWLITLWAFFALGSLILVVSGLTNEAPALFIAGLTGFVAIAASMSAYWQRQKNARKVLA